MRRCTSLRSIKCSEILKKKIIIHYEYLNEKTINYILPVT